MKTASANAWTSLNVGQSNAVTTFNCNTMECEPGAAYGLLLRSRDPVVTGNRLRVRGSGAAIRFDGDYIAASITNNDITVDAGAGIMLDTGGHDACTITRNRIAATNGSVAIHVASPSKTDKQRIEQNTISGFAQGVKQEGRWSSASGSS